MSLLSSGIAAVGIDIGKNSFHIVGQDERGEIVLHTRDPIRQQGGGSCINTTGFVLRFFIS
jgi:hypothetical protein